MIETRSSFIEDHEFRVSDEMLDSLETRARNHCTGEVDPRSLRELVAFYREGKRIKELTKKGIDANARPKDRG